MFLNCALSDDFLYGSSPCAQHARISNIDPAILRRCYSSIVLFCEIRASYKLLLRERMVFFHRLALHFFSMDKTRSAVPVRSSLSTLLSGPVKCSSLRVEDHFLVVPSLHSHEFLDRLLIVLQQSIV
ncbi:hypothetical protein Tco_0198775 [Tanacetum coccineum]